MNVIIIIETTNNVISTLTSWTNTKETLKSEQFKTTLYTEGFTVIIQAQIKGNIVLKRSGKMQKATMIECKNGSDRKCSSAWKTDWILQITEQLTPIKNERERGGVMAGGSVRRVEGGRRRGRREREREERYRITICLNVMSVCSSQWISLKC